jgi:hypothetical protein
MYLHAERLLAKAGRQSARGGVSPIRSKAEDERSEGLHKRSAEDCWETLALRQGRALSEAWFPYSCALAHITYGEGVAGRKVPLRRVAEDARAAADREERRSTLQTVVVAVRFRSELGYCQNELDCAICTRRTFSASYLSIELSEEAPPYSVS